mgnify:CR=1 FL=1
MKISPIKRRELASRRWCVHTTHKITEEGLTAFLSSIGDAEDSRGEIFYSGEMLPVFLVPFVAAEYLAENQRTGGQGTYECRIFHREKGNTRWQEWRMEVKTAKEKVRDLFRTSQIRKAI